MPFIDAQHHFLQPPLTAVNRAPKKSFRARDRSTYNARQAHAHARLAPHSAQYVRAHVQLGYAATAHGHQGDTVDVSLTLVAAATTHRSLYVGATQGRDENRLLVVTGEDEDARDVLEHVLTNDRVDLPAVAQRRVLTEQARGAAGDSITDAPERALARARHALAEAGRRGEPELRALAHTTDALETAETELRAARWALQEAPRLRRRAPAERVKTAEHAYAAAADHHAVAARAAAPHTGEVATRQAEVDRAERALSAARLKDRLDRLAMEPPSRSLGRSPLGR